MAEEDSVSTTTVNRAYQNAWIVYINGLEVPVSSVSISYGVWKVPQAEIVMFPEPVLQRLGAEDRIAVQVFYCDQWYSSKNSEFRLLFDGEIVAWNYVNVHRGRTISFTAVDYIQIFTQLFFFYMSSIDDIAKGVSNQSIGVNINGVNLAGMRCLFPYSLFAQGLVSPENTNTRTPLIRRPIDYIYNVVRGFIQDVPLRSVPACNFFAPWTKKTNFHRRFIALPYLEEDPKQDVLSSTSVFPILRAVQADFAVAAVNKLALQVGSSGSIWDVFTEILTTLMMEFSMLPTPMAVRTDDTLYIRGLGYNEINTKNEIHLGNYFVKPALLFGLPPTCNVFFPSQINTYAYQENYITQPTRMYFGAESYLTHLAPHIASPGTETILRNALSVAYPEEAHQVLQNALKTPSQNGRNTLIYPEEFFRGPVVDERKVPRWFTFLGEAQAASLGKSADPESKGAQLKSAQDLLPGDSSRNLYKKYAAYEFAKEKYSRRNASLTMAFNPYPVPGFPCAVFDQRHTKLDIFGYVMDVRHTLSSREMSTAVNVSYGRTIKEVFNLLRKQVEMENAIMRSDRSVVYEALNNKNLDLTKDIIPQNMERVGAIAIAPAEPLREIRDVTQNFKPAEDFYRTLFHGFVDPKSVKQNETTKEADANRDNPEDNDLNQSLPNENEELLQSIAPEDAALLTNSPDQPGEPNYSFDPNAGGQLTVTNDVDGSGSPLWNAGGGVRKTAVFRYDDILQLEAKSGAKEAIALEGMDGSTRVEMLGIIQKIRDKSATDTDIANLEAGLGNSPLTTAGRDFINPDDEALQVINSFEEYFQNLETITNITGTDVEIVPNPKNINLFTNFADAMRYNSRPICTLDNYLAFLGEDASPEGRQSPKRALVSNDQRTFPGVYYKYIRKYRAGPPTILPGLNMTNSSYIMSPDGLFAVPYRQETLSLEALQAVTEAGENLTGTVDTSAATRQNTKVAAALRNVEGIPDDFPETIEDWDRILNAYREAVLTRQYPSR